MNSDKYFKIVSEYGNVIHIRPQGNWDDKIAAEYGEELKTKFRKAVDDMHLRGRKFIVLANMSHFHVKGEKTRQLLTELMKTSAGNELFYRTVQIVPDPETRLEIQQSSQNAGQGNVRFVVASLEEANDKILELKKELLSLI